MERQLSSFVPKPGMSQQIKDVIIDISPDDGKGFRKSVNGINAKCCGAGIKISFAVLIDVCLWP
jgi:hypothetical protein